MNIKRYFRRNMYRWHRVSSVIIALPVICWALSGFMHPLMTNIKPKVATQSLAVTPVDTSRIFVSLQQALRQNNIDTINNFRLVQMTGYVFYQVKLPAQPVLRYFSAADGKELKNGDKIYSRYLARYFLEQPSTDAAITNHDADCCMKVTMAVMRPVTGNKISSVKMITAFDEEYKYINRLLPVYRVSFDRPDGIRIYVDPAADRFAFAMDNNRAAFDKFFAVFHTWSWMDGVGDMKYILMVFVTFLALFTTSLGLYIFFTTNVRKKANGITRTRRFHRTTALIASLFVLMFTFSGGYHALSKITEEENKEVSAREAFTNADLSVDWNRLTKVTGSDTITNLSVVRLKGQSYLQVFLAGKKVAYVSPVNYAMLETGEKTYAKDLANKFSGYTGQQFRKIELINRFNDEYPFINKRLPVWKVTYDVPGNERLYVETSTGALASRVTDEDLYEGYSFALLHKHHFMDWGGKATRDTSTMIAAGLVLIAAVIGVILFFRVLKHNFASQIGKRR